MTPTTLAETILRDVPRYECWEMDPDAMRASLDGQYIEIDAVLAALTAALDPALSERAGEVLAWRTQRDEPDDLDRAADLITALLAQLAALRAERDDALASASRADQAAKADYAARVAAEAQIAALTARVERLAGALAQIADQQADHAAVDRCNCTPEEMLNEARAIARAALTTEEGPSQSTVSAREAALVGAAKALASWCVKNIQPNLEMDTALHALDAARAAITEAGT